MSNSKTGLHRMSVKIGVYGNILYKSDRRYKYVGKVDSYFEVRTLAKDKADLEQRVVKRVLDLFYKEGLYLSRGKGSDNRIDVGVVGMLWSKGAMTDFKQIQLSRIDRIFQRKFRHLKVKASKRMDESSKAYGISYANADSISWEDLGYEENT